MVGKIGIMTVKDGKILFSGDSLPTVSVGKEETPRETIRNKYGLEIADFVGNVNGMDIFLVHNFPGKGEWIDPNDSKLNPFRDKVLPHLMWTGLI